MGKNTVQAKQWLDKCYLDSALVKTMIKRWYVDFKHGCNDTNDAECLGCPNSKCPRKHQKTSHTCFGWSRIEVAWDSRGVEDIKRQCSVFTILYEHLSNEKALFKVGDAFAHSC